MRLAFRRHFLLCICSLSSSQALLELNCMPTKVLSLYCVLSLINSVFCLTCAFSKFLVYKVTMNLHVGLKLHLILLLLFKKSLLYFFISVSIHRSRIGGVMVSTFASCALHFVYHGFEPWSWSGKTKGYEIGVCCFSAKHTSLRTKTKSKDWCWEWVEQHHANMSIATSGMFQELAE